MKKVLDLTTRPIDDLFYKRDDPMDRKLGEFVRRDPNDYVEADFVIVGCPQDEGVKRNKGRPGAALAPTEIRKAFYKFPITEGLFSKILFDLGDVKIGDTLEQTHETLTEVIYQIVTDDKKLIILGGGNDISYPDCLALSRVNPDILAFNIDSHYDVRKDQPRNSGTPYRQLLEENILKPEKFFEVAANPLVNSPEYTKYLENKGVKIVTLNTLREYGIDKIITKILQEQNAEAIFWGFDLDSVRTMDAPGVSAPNPIGLSADEICRIAFLAGKQLNSKILEISEVNPNYDLDNRTSKLAATIMLYFLNAYDVKEESK